MAASLAGEPRKFSLPAARTIGGMGRVELDLPERVVPQIDDRPGAADRLGMAAENLQSLIRFDRRDDADDRGENARAVADAI